jgi:hypothetical protein
MKTCLKTRNALSRPFPSSHPTAHKQTQISKAKRKKSPKTRRQAAAPTKEKKKMRASQSTNDNLKERGFKTTIYTPGTGEDDREGKECISTPELSATLPALRDCRLMRICSCATWDICGRSSRWRLQREQRGNELSAGYCIAVRPAFFSAR